jgi:hypothetical protein
VLISKHPPGTHMERLLFFHYRPRRCVNHDVAKAFPQRIMGQRYLTVNPKKHGPNPQAIPAGG